MADIQLKFANMEQKEKIREATVTSLFMLLPLMKADPSESLFF